MKKKKLVECRFLAEVGLGKNQWDLSLRAFSCTGKGLSNSVAID